MKKLLVLILIFLSGSGCWTTISTVKANLAGKSGTFARSGFTHIEWDSANGRVYMHENYLATGESPAYNATIYGNADYALIRKGAWGGGDDTLRQFFLNSCTWNTTVSKTQRNSAYATTATPFDQHQFFFVKNDTMYQMSGLNSQMQDTIDVSAVDTAGDSITLVKKMLPWSHRDAVQFVSSLTLPTPLVAGTVYFIDKLGDSTFKLAANSLDAASHTNINLMTAGTGTIRMLHAVTDAWHYNTPWRVVYGSGVGTTSILSPKNVWSRNAVGFITDCVFQSHKNRAFCHYNRNSENTAEYSWAYYRANDSMVELSTLGNKRNGEAPEMRTPGCMAYNRLDSCNWVFGDQDTTDAGGNPYDNQLWKQCKDSAWVKLTPVTPRPRKRTGQGVILAKCDSSSRGCLISCGGTTYPNNDTTGMTDCWEYRISLNNWDSLETYKLPHGGGAYLTYDRRNTNDAVMGTLLLQMAYIPDGDTSFYYQTYGIADIFSTTNPNGLIPIMEGF